MDETVVAFDLKRMILGSDPSLFYLEILVRTVIVYAWALLLLRWLGSRTIGQLSTIEFLLVIALGSAIGDAMFYPEVPLLHALLVVTVVVLINKGLDLLIARFKTAERVLDGVPEPLVSDGVIGRHFLKSSTMGSSEVFQQLRRQGVRNLGEVRAAYVEPDGAISVFRHDGHGHTGLPIEPPWEIKPLRKILEGQQANTQALACRRCGTVTDPGTDGTAGRCPHCEGTEWSPAGRAGDSSED